MLNYEVVFEIWVLEKDNFSKKTLHESMDYISPFTENMFLKKEKWTQILKLLQCHLCSLLTKIFWRDFNLVESTQAQCQNVNSLVQLLKNKKLSKIKSLLRVWNSFKVQFRFLIFIYANFENFERSVYSWNTVNVYHCFIENQCIDVHRN